jgi:hypothetical protein
MAKTMSKNMAKSPKPVSFNAGRKVYEVSRSLVKSFPESLLARKTSSDAVTTEGIPIFIDRDGERDQTVQLQVNIMKEAIYLERYDAVSLHHYFQQ